VLCPKGYRRAGSHCLREKMQSSENIIQVGTSEIVVQRGACWTFLHTVLSFLTALPISRG